MYTSARTEERIRVTAEWIFLPNYWLLNKQSQNAFSQSVPGKAIYKDYLVLGFHATPPFYYRESMIQRDKRDALPLFTSSTSMP